MAKLRSFHYYIISLPMGEVTGTYSEDVSCDHAELEDSYVVIEASTGLRFLAGDSSEQIQEFAP